jgi:hypothetical protein
MLPGKVFEQFVEKSPVSVMVMGALERVLDPGRIQDVFDDNAVLQYTRDLTFFHCGQIMSDVVFQVSRSVGAWYQAHPDEWNVTRQAVYDKLKPVELPTSATLVRYSSTELLPAAKALDIRPQPLLSGYRVRVLVRLAMRAVHGRAFVDEQLSPSCVTLEMSQVSAGMRIAIDEEHRNVFRTMSVKQFAATLLDLAGRMDPRKYTKHKRTPKIPQPKKLNGRKIKHVSTAKLIAARK